VSRTIFSVRLVSLTVVTTRLCRHQGCSNRAKATLTFAYADRTAVLGPLAPARSAEGIDLCLAHCERLSAPRGWDVVRLPLDEPGQTTPLTPDLKALADAVRQAAGIAPASLAASSSRGVATTANVVTTGNVVTLAERRHLRVVADPVRRQAS